VDGELCAGRGERYFPARTLDKIDALIQGEHEVKALLSVDVFSV